MTAPTDVFVARSVALRFALTCGLPTRRAGSAAIVAGELSSNMVRHAGGGWLQLERLATGLQILARDRGSLPSVPAEVLEPLQRAPISVDDLGRVQPGLGCGLAAIHRLSNDVTAWIERGGGLCVCAVLSHLGVPPAPTNDH